MNTGIHQRRKLQNQRIWNRKDKLSYIDTYIETSDANMLEIGPSVAPLWSVDSFPMLRYLETVDAAGLQERAKIKSKVSPIKNVHFVFDEKLGFEKSIQGTTDYKYVSSSHVIEHIPDFVGHLQAIERICSKDGYYFAIVPDKNIIFDKDRSCSTLGDVVSHHVENKTSLTAAIDSMYYALETDDDKRKGWWNSNDTHDLVRRNNTSKLENFCIDKFLKNGMENWFGHFHVFDPISFCCLTDGLRMLGLLNLSLCDLVSTGHMDFIAVFKNDHGASHMQPETVYESLSKQNYPFLNSGGVRSNIYRREV